MSPQFSFNAMQGKRILFLRPVADSLLERLRLAGADVRVFPTISFGLIPNSAIGEMRCRLDGFDFVMAVSQHAVHYAFTEVAYGSAVVPRPDVIALAPGPATALAFKRAGWQRILMPVESFDSEGLLALPELGTGRNARILVAKGVGGRDFFATEMRRRGSYVETLDCYRRQLAAPPSEEIVAWGLAAKPDIIVAASAEALQNGVQLLEADWPWLKQQMLMVGHARVAEAAALNGWRHVINELPWASETALFSAIRGALNRALMA